MTYRPAGWSPFAKVYNPLQAGSIDGTDEHPHDHAVIRASNAKYAPNKLVLGDPEATIFISRLSSETNEQTLEKIFEEYGDIKRLRLVRDIVTGFSKHYAFIEYYDGDRAIEAREKANKLEIDGSEIFVDYECERILRGWIPRRLGGGFGGKKEAGQLRFGGRDKPFKMPILVSTLWKNESRDRTGGDDNWRNREEKLKDNNSDQRERYRDSNRDYRGRRDRDRDNRSRDRSRERFREVRHRRSRSRERRRSRSRSRDRNRDRDRGEQRNRRNDKSTEDITNRTGRF